MSSTGATMSTTTTTDAPASDPTPDYPWDLNPSPTRLRAHNPAGFTRLYLLPPPRLTAPVECQQRHGDVTASLSLKTRVQTNLIRLFQLAVFFDDFLIPRNQPAPEQEQQPPSDKLMTIIETLWDVDTPLGPDLMREVLDHWYERHVDWWKANRRSKHAVEKGRELLLVNLADQYRRSRRYGARRVREASSVDPAVVVCGEEDGIRDGDGDGEYHLRLLGSRVLQWKQVMFNCPGAVYERVLPVPPMMDGFMVNKGAVMAEHLIYRLLKAPIIERGMALSQLLVTDCSWMLADSDPASREMYRKLKIPKEPEKEKDEPAHDQTDHEETLGHQTETEIAEEDDETEVEVEDRDEPRLRKKRACTEPSTQGNAATPDYDASGEDEELAQDTVLASVEDTEDESSDDEDEDDAEDEEQDDEIAETKDAAEVTDEDDEEYDPDDEDDEDYED